MLLCWDMSETKKIKETNCDDLQAIMLEPLYFKGKFGEKEFLLRYRRLTPQEQTEVNHIYRSDLPSPHIDKSKEVRPADDSRRGKLR